MLNRDSHCHRQFGRARAMFLFDPLYFTIYETANVFEQVHKLLIARLYVFIKKNKELAITRLLSISFSSLFAPQTGLSMQQLSHSWKNKKSRAELTVFNTFLWDFSPTLTQTQYPSALPSYCNLLSQYLRHLSSRGQLAIIFPYSFV